MRDHDDAALELRLRRVLADRLDSLPLDLTVEDLERRRLVRVRARRRRRTTLGLGLAAALLLPAASLLAGWLIAAGQRQPPDRQAVVDGPSVLGPASPGPSLAAPSSTPTGVPAAGRLVVYPVTRRLQVGEGTCTEGGAWEACTELKWWISNADGTAAHPFVVDDPARWFPLNWSPDGRALLALSPDRLALIDEHGHVLRRYAVGTCPMDGFCTMDTGSASWSPDATRIAFDWAVGDFNKSKVTSGLAMLDLETGNVKEVPGTRSVNGEADRPSWSPDGSRLLFGRRGMSPEPGSPVTSGAVFIVGVDGSDLRRVTPSGVYATSGSWSPDASTIAFTRVTMTHDKATDSVVEAGQDIYTIGVDGTQIRRLTDDGASSEPRWAAGSRLTFVRRNTNWTMNADGSGQAELGFDLGTLTDAGCESCLYPGPDVSLETRGALWQPAP